MRVDKPLRETHHLRRRQLLAIASRLGKFPARPLTLHPSCASLPIDTDPLGEPAHQPAQPAGGDVPARREQASKPAATSVVDDRSRDAKAPAVVRGWRAEDD
jgi:hypothetical protein